jgi:hypothetical protein
MSTQTFTNYWIGQEPTGPGQSPTLNEMPSYVDVVPLAFVGIDANEQLDFGFLTQQNSAETIQGWIKEVRANGTKVLFSINSQQLGAIKNPEAFAQNVAQNAAAWGVDGIDFDFEPPYTPNTLIEVVQNIRTAMGNNALLTAPIYSAWLGYLDFLGTLAENLDYLTTMDYTPYPGFSQTISLYNTYASAIGNPSKLGIGISCMEPPNNFTPLNDVIELCRWEPSQGTKQGAMLYTFSYDIETRPGAGTGYPNGTWTQTIHENLP